MKNALIFGGTGFVGSHLSNSLKSTHNVTSIGRTYDVRDASLVLRAIDDVKPDSIVFLSSITTLKESFDNPKLCYDITMKGLENVFNAIRSLGLDTSFLFVSSSEVYRKSDSPDPVYISERSETTASSPYAISKLAGEQICGYWSNILDSKICIARPFNHIGPGQDDRFVVSKIAKHAAMSTIANEAIVVSLGNMMATRDFTDVRDVANAYNHLLHNGRDGGIYNVCSGNVRSIKDIVDLTITVTGADLEIETSSNHVNNSACHIGLADKLRLETTWKPLIPIHQTIADTYQYWMKELNGD